MQPHQSNPLKTRSSNATTAIIQDCEGDPVDLLSKVLPANMDMRCQRYSACNIKVQYCKFNHNTLQLVSLYAIKLCATYHLTPLNFKC